MVYPFAESEVFKFGGPCSNHSLLELMRSSGKRKQQLFSFDQLLYLRSDFSKWRFNLIDAKNCNYVSTVSTLPDTAEILFPLA